MQSRSLTNRLQRSRSLLCLTVLLTSLLALPAKSQADTALTRAVVQAVRNQVRLFPQDDQARAAEIDDILNPGDGLATERRSLAELRFNDGSLGRLGEQVTFWFSSGGREFQLSNGTILLLIPPGRGRSYIRTPNAAAGIQGSALFVRHIAETNTTIIGALTNSGIRVFNQDGSQEQELKAGQIAVAVEGRIERVYDFDLPEFYRSSPLVQGLTPNEVRSSDPAIAAVQAEMAEGEKNQGSLSSNSTVAAPTNFRIPSTSPSTTPTTPSSPTPTSGDNQTSGGNSTNAPTTAGSGTSGNEGTATTVIETSPTTRTQSTSGVGEVREDSSQGHSLSDGQLGGGNAQADGGGRLTGGSDVDAGGRLSGGGHADFGGRLSGGGQADFGGRLSGGGEADFGGRLSGGGNADFGGRLSGGGDRLDSGTQLGTGDRIDSGSRLNNVGEVDLGGRTDGGGQADFGGRTDGGGGQADFGGRVDGGGGAVDGGGRVDGGGGLVDGGGRIGGDDIHLGGQAGENSNLDRAGAGELPAAPVERIDNTERVRSSNNQPKPESESESGSGQAGNGSL